MKVVVAGGTGFLGSALIARLLARGDEVVVLTRGEQEQAPRGVTRVVWPADGTDGLWSHHLVGAGAVVNLAGAGIEAKRWTAARKRVIRESRVKSTRSLAAALRNLSPADRPRVFIQGSAVGFYGTPGDQLLDEASPPGEGFLASVVVDWEAEARPIEALGTRLVIVRSGVVLAAGGGALAKMSTPYKFFVGGPIGSGTQYLSWIHRDDWVSIVLWAIDTSPVAGVINASAPEPVTYEVLGQALGRALHRPNWLRVPGFALRTLVGPMADDALLQGQRVLPRRVTELGYTFSRPTIDSALR